MPIRFARLLAVPFLATLAATASAQSRFDAPRFLTESQGGSVRELGDFDGDQDVDLVHVLGFPSQDWSGFRLLRNDGTAHFAPSASIDFPQSLGFGFVARAEPQAGDYDGDGDLDLAFDHFLNVFFSGAVGGLEVYLGDGAGGFAAPVNSGVATALGFLPGQIDGDPAQEIALWGQDLSGNHFFWWLDWNGSGFTPSAALPMNHGGDPAGGLLRAVLLDVDGDGDDDVAGTSQNSQLLRLIVTTAGQPAYGPFFALPAALADPNHHSLAGDPDGDGDLDLIHLRIQSGPSWDPFAMVFRNDGGVLVPQPETTLDLPTDVLVNHDWQLRDWDEDGRLDLLEYSNQIVQLRGDGALGFQFAGAVQLSSQLNEAGAADLNGDQHLDLAASDAVYLGDGTAKSAPAGPADSEAASVHSAAFVEDREDDGDLDLLASTLASPGSYRQNDAAGGFAFGTAALPALPPAQLFGQAVAFADFTGDGRRDFLVGTFQSILPPFIVQFVEMVWLIDDGVGGYQLSSPVTPPGVQIFAQTSDRTWPVGDVDADGDPDVLVKDGHWENSGVGFGAAPVPSYIGTPLAAADFEGDGDLDLFVWRLGGGNPYGVYLLRQAGGTFASEFLNGWNQIPHALLRDLDADGDLDLVAGSFADDVIALRENVGGVAVDAGALPSRLTRPLAVAVDDVDGDGLGDLLAPGIGTSGFGPPAEIGLAWFRRTGAGLVYAAPEIFKSFYDVTGFLDSDGDGDVDAVSPLTVESTEHVEPASGRIRQYGAPAAGSGSIAPILGASGPVWAGSTSGTLRLRRGLGGAPCILIFGFVQTALPGTPLPGLTLYTSPYVMFPTFPLTGATGQPGAGTFTFGLPTDGALAGLRAFHQVFVIDAASPSGIASHTNGLEILYGS